MQRFEIFTKVCDFFINCALDTNYISNIDAQLEKPGKETKIVTLVKHVKAFHSMRRSLCQKILKRLGNNDFFNILAEARGLKQYSTAPELSTCILSGIKLKSDNGILLIIDNSKLVTIHSRYKIVIYHFWTLVHMPDEIALHSMKWLKQQPWWKNGSQISAKECTKRLLSYNDKQFAKGFYVKLKSIAEYIENNLADIPIHNA